MRCVDGFAGWPDRPEAPPALGDRRWTADLILSTWAQGARGEAPDHLEHRVGDSGGGFDRPPLPRPRSSAPGAPPDRVDTSLRLNRRGRGADRSIPVPWYGGGMSYGSVSEQVMLARAMAAQTWKTFTSTGEGGYPEALTALRRPCDHPDRHRDVRRPRGDDPAGADRRVQVRPGGQARAGRSPAGRQGHHRRGQDARVGALGQPVLALSLPQRLLGGGSPQAPRLDSHHPPGGAAFGQGLDPHRRRHGGGGQLLRRRAYPAHRRLVRRHRSRAGDRQEEHRHADRVRHSDACINSWKPRASATR